MRTGMLKAVLGFGFVSTALHFTHNYLAIEHYPQAGGISDATVRAAIVISWPIFTAIAIYGYRLYARGAYRAARGWLLGYALFTFVSLGHFTTGTPHVPAFWLATIFTDALAGLLVIAFLLAGPPTPAASARRTSG